MSTKEQNPQNNNPRNIRFPNQMIEQQLLTSLLSKKSENFSAWVIEACRRRLTSEKRAYTSIKSDEEWTSHVLPSEQDDIVNSLNCRGIAVIQVAVLPTFLTVTDCVLALSQNNSLND